MNLEILITGGVGVITSIISAWISWFFTRKKYNAEVDSTLLNNLKDSLEFYKTLSDDNRERLEGILKRNDLLEEEVKELRKLVTQMLSLICSDLTCRHRLSKSLEE